MSFMATEFIVYVKENCYKNTNIVFYPLKTT